MKTEPVTRQELERYLKGNISPEEKHQIEMKLQNSDFNADAIEGYEENPDAIHQLDDLQNKYNKQFNTGKNIFKPLIITTVSICVIVISAWYLINLNESETITSEEIAGINKTEQTLVKEQIVADNEINEAILIEEPEQITYEKTIENQIKPIELQKIQPISVLKPETLKIELTTPNLEVIINNRNNTEIDYVHDLKIMDYSGIYKTQIKKFWYDLGGLDAQYENESRKTEPDIFDYKVEYIPYRRFLADALAKFVRNDFKGTLKDLNTISIQFPNDQNANFYSGLCYYNLGKWKKAIKSFDQTIKHPINIFDEEALWYKALALIKNDDIEEAREILQEIVTKNGFYADRAGTILDKL